MTLRAVPERNGLVRWPSCRRPASPVAAPAEAPRDAGRGATLDRAGDLQPQAHAYFGQVLPWIKPADGLSRYKTVSSEGPPLP